MIRTHDAGTPRAPTTSARPSPSPAGWPAAATTAASRSSTCARPAASSRSSIRDEAVAHQPAQRVLPQGHRRGRRCGPRATPTRTCRPARSRSIADRASRCSAQSAPLPFPIDDARRGRGEEARLKHRYLDLRRTGPAAALRLRSKVNKAARDVLDAPRLRRDRDADADPLDARGRPRLPGAGAAAARAAGTPCRRARSCSSSC